MIYGIIECSSLKSLLNSRKNNAKEKLDFIFKIKNSYNSFRFQD